MLYCFSDLTSLPRLELEFFLEYNLLFHKSLKSSGASILFDLVLVFVFVFGFGSKFLFVL